VILGKTNVPFGLADWQSYNAIYGVTNNPWDLKQLLVDRREALPQRLRPANVRSRLDRTWSARCGCLRTIAARSRTSRAMGWSRCEASDHRTRPTQCRHAIDLAVVGPMARSAGDVALALDVLADPMMPTRSPTISRCRDRVTTI